MSVGIPRPVGVILHRDRRQMLAVVPYWCIWRRAIMANRAGNVAPAFPSVRTIAGHRQDLRHARRLLRCHLLNARHHHHIVQSGCNCRECMEKGRSARRAGRFDPRTWNTLDAHGSGDVRRQMALADKRRAGEVARGKTPRPARRRPAHRPELSCPLRPQARKSWSGNTPKGVFPMPITATGLILQSE